MATNVGDLVVKLGADTREFEQAMGRATGPNSALGQLGTVARNGAIAAGVAIAGFSAKGIADFMALDTGMREVFTLLPGITQDAMDDMTADVLAFSAAFGKLPEEVVPALYQALSAGVPQDNVLAFMEVAAQTAIGGVATLEEAVDVLSSVVNAYGADVISADEASDILFTTVRLGKTDMSQLAAVVSRVTPIANSLGVEFEDVGAAMAALTATGVPTAEAATQLRSLMAELGDSTKGAGQTFMDLAGQTFPQFIEGGGTLEDALVMLADEADRMGLRMADNFGSIEAGMGATVLTSENGAVLFGNAMTEMQNASGATEAAFEVMDNGIGASWNRLKANFATLSAEVGQQLAPMFKEGVDWVVQVGMPALRDGVAAAFEKIQEFTAILTEAWHRYQTDSDGTFANVRGIVEAFAAAVGAAFELIKTLWETVLLPTWNAIAPVVTVAVEVISDVLTALAALLQGDFVGAWEAMSSAVTTITDGLKEWLQATWNSIKEWLGTLFGNIATNAGMHWDGVVGAIKGAFDGFVGWVQGIFDSVVGVIQGALDGVMAAAQTVMDFVNRVLGRANDAEQAANNAASALADAEANANTGGSTAAGGAGGGAAGNAGGRALGGIVTGPMRAIIGESGPEAVIPLERLDRMMHSLVGTGGGMQTTIVELDGQVLMRSVAPRLVDTLRLRTGVAGL